MIMTFPRFLLSLCLALAAVIPAAGDKPADIAKAEDWCDNNALHRVEGIWIYPDDDVTVLVRRHAIENGTYDIISIESGDGSFSPGERIGQIISISDPAKFKMILFTQRKKNILTRPKECAATLALDDYAMRVEHKSKKFQFNLFFLLPRFWRMARITTDDPTKSLPFGMKKIYPSYDGNGSSRFNPRYL